MKACGVVDSYTRSVPRLDALTTAERHRHSLAMDTGWMRASWQYWITGTGQRPGPWWMQWVWTVLFALAIAAAFTVAGFALHARSRAAWLDLGAWGLWLKANFTITICISVVIQLLYRVLNPRFRNPRIARWKPWQSSAYHLAVPLAGVLIGWPIGLGLVVGEVRWAYDWVTAPSAIANMVLVSLVVATILHQWFTAKARQILAEREAAEAQLRLLQGQIEPHFLFNTLANVSSLMEVDPERARLMLDSFVDYLRSSLLGLRASEQTLGAELALVEAYLRVQGIRLEDRLHSVIDVPPALRSLRLPTLLLQPLVENAVVHGIEPSLAGGTVWVRVAEAGGVLQIVVEDDGVGLSGSPAPGELPASSRASTGHGQALRNLRDRLHRLHGARASVEVVVRQPSGVRVTVRLPAAA